MRNGKFLLARLRPHRSMLKSEPGAALFRHLRIRLTLWYCAVLGCALLLFCLALYIGARHLLYAPAEDYLPQQANAIADAFHRLPSFDCTPPPGPAQDPAFKNFQKDFSENAYIACYSTQTKLLHASTEQASSKFITDTSLIQRVLRTSQAQSDIIDSGGTAGRIYRYATPVMGPPGTGPIGIVQLGRSLADIDNALNTLLSLLFILGAVVLVGAGLGGLFLANRALEPTRTALTRQQRFIADASHELRTPLTFLCANTEILLDGRERLDPDDISLLEDIYTEANHMNALADNMLALARLDADEHPTHHEHDIVDLSKLAKSIAHQAKALAAKKDLRIEVSADKPLYVIGDPILLEQAVLILVDNAMKYNQPGGHVLLSTSTSEGLACLQVRDTGIGIAPEHLMRLGERFYRVDKARSRSAGGTGLGLSIAYGIAKTHKGNLQLSSTLSEGTTATFCLPNITETLHSNTSAKITPLSQTGAS